MKDDMTRVESIVLACFAPGKGKTHTPVQVQKLFFLVDQKLADDIGGKLFSFEPYNYGPFDKDVYRVLEALSEKGMVEVVQENPSSMKCYRLSSLGQKVGEAKLAALSATVKAYVQQLSEFVHSLSFPQLVSAIYKAFPEMKANSVFK